MGRIIVIIMMLAVGGCSTLDHEACGPADHIVGGARDIVSTATFVVGLSGPPGQTVKLDCEDTTGLPHRRDWGPID